jgi:hypothetical protein
MTTLSTPVSQEKELFINMVLQLWNSNNTRITKLLDSLTDEQLMKETAPGRNRGIYLLGHLIAVSDGLHPLFGLGDRLYPTYVELFLTSPDGKHKDLPSLAELRHAWANVHEKLSDHFKKMEADAWFQRHNSVSEEDFKKEPHRNKLNVLINRANHANYHLGQLVYLGEKESE